ncbi:MAG TPA: DUF192 domain-containing protein [Rhizomicrobium sp.]|nr:DUF192 domain-containing protein [Rhizomicrobium sp.]
MPNRAFAAAVLLCALPFSAAAVPTSPNGKLPVTAVIIDTEHGSAKFQAEVASDPVSQEKGLMFRKSMAPDAGMLFDFHKPDFQTFWMKNTLIPLDMIFIRADGTISSIAPNATPQSETPIPSYEPVRAVLEISGGRAAQLGILPGEHVHAAIFGNVAAGKK